MDGHKLILKKGRERSVKKRHPWIFSGAIKDLEGGPGLGDTVNVFDSYGNFLAKAFYSPKSEIRARIWTFKDEPIDELFFQRRLECAIKRRKGLIESTNAVRLIYSESDGLPGLIVDQFNDVLVCQFLSAGVEKWKGEIVKALVELVHPKSIFERSDAGPRKKEGLQLKKGLLYGETPPDLIEIHENGARFFVDVKQGQKTGFYLDQRDNRWLLSKFSFEKDVLNCFSYTGGFSVFSLIGGANSITDIEISRNSLDLLKKNLQLNATNVPLPPHEAIKGDAFKILRTFRDSARTFDCIVLDPPKFAESKENVKRACRGYKDINLLAMKLLRPGGILFTFSCSGLIDHDLFQKVIAGAAIDSGRDVRIIKRLQQGPDHPVLMTFPEASYLKGFVLKVE
ncbi:LSU m5C1962 methyltransferase RlmI [Dissulfuribacter thermophilus]|uniref:LSU m5C1962 methyltransferase RlmI n=1 Tax=Dissulfuribacter thermophilus TaxID=1156395 RepID=A0A1B9F8S3_9BACT|nr:class I SAM-dependent methyltransferase [Dissulfuribacter thermophilus]OCC16254.1 LSU m5C1962 methyltransferase RlmI [Dissulfuribacter thermophilus]